MNNHEMIINCQAFIHCIGEEAGKMVLDIDNWDKTV